MPDNITEKIEAFFSEFKPRTYPKGQLLLMEGDEAKNIFYLIRGKVKQYDTTYRGEEIILNIFKQNAFFPMSLIVNKGPSLYTFSAETEIEVCEAPAGKVLEFIKENPEVMFDLLSRVYKGTDGLLNKLSLLMSGTAKSRVLFELYTECRRFGKALESGGVELTISETELAARAGLSRETVSREFHKLKSEDIITFSGPHILVNDPAGIEKKLNISS